MRPLSFRTRVAIALLITVGLVLGLWTWHDNTRTLTLRDLLDGRSFAPGSTRNFAGTITGINPYNSTYGPFVLLRLDYDESCFPATVFGDPTVTYEYGERFQTVLHFESVTVDGTSLVWARELACPFPWTAMSTSEDVDEWSFNQGRVLRPDIFADGWMSYRVDHVWSWGANPFRLNNLSAYLLARTPAATGPVVDSAPEWMSRWGYEKAQMSFYPTRAWGEEVDRLSRLSDHRSTNNRIRFVDTNQNDLVDEGDVLQVRLKPAGENGYRTYFLGLSPGEGSTIAGKYIVQGPEGPYEWIGPG